MSVVFVRDRHRVRRVDAADKTLMPVVAFCDTATAADEIVSALNALPILLAALREIEAGDGRAPAIARMAIKKATEK